MRWIPIGCILGHLSLRNITKWPCVIPSSTLPNHRHNGPYSCSQTPFFFSPSIDYCVSPIPSPPPTPIHQLISHLPPDRKQTKYLKRSCLVCQHQPSAGLASLWPAEERTASRWQRRQQQYKHTLAAHCELSLHFFPTPQSVYPPSLPGNTLYPGAP